MTVGRLRTWQRRLGRSLAGAALLLGLGWLAFEALIAALPMPDLARAGRVSTVVLADDRKILKAYLSADGAWRLKATPDDVPAHYLNMLLAYEDRRFFAHGGVDMLAVTRAAYLLMRRGRIVSGASTITMQTVRLLEGQRPGLWSKIRQAALALKLERNLDKREILSLYLTLAPFGGNIEGVRAASLHYFGIEPGAMSVGQAAMLVALPQSPERRRPRANSSASREARDRVLRQMVARKVLPATAAAAALQEPVPTRRGAHPFIAHHLSDRLRTESPDADTITTLIDRTLQIRLESIAARFVARQPDPANVAMLVIRRSDMAVRGYVGGAAYFDEARAGMFDHVRAIRSPGSALKPLIYGMAFEDLIVHPSTIVFDHITRYPGYAPENFDRVYRGDLVVRDALVQSVNTVAVMLLDRVGTDRFIGRLRAAGIPVVLPSPHVPPGLAVGLGGLGISLENLATMYAGIANRGRVQPPRFRTRDIRSDARPLLPRDAAWAVTDVLADAPPARGRGALRAQDGGRRVAYKTGTSYGFKDSWVVGFDADHVVAVWAGRPDGIGRPGETAATTAVPLMQSIFDVLPVPERDVAADRPSGTILAHKTDLPERLRRYAPRLAPSRDALSGRQLEIRFPSNDSTIKLARAGQVYAPLTIAATGGRPPFRWYVDGRLLADHPAQSRIEWRPDGRGQVEFVIVDADGRRAASKVWLD